MRCRSGVRLGIEQFGFPSLIPFPRGRGLRVGSGGYDIGSKVNFEYRF